jgi:myo-inositol-1(or 4)-monophosphatase
MVRQLNRLEALTVEEKSRNEFVTQVDRAAEEAIIEVIKDHYPEHAILAEESGARASMNINGSSTRSTARRTTCTAFRSSRSRSASRAKASSSTASSTIRCGKRSSQRAAARARSSTVGASRVSKRTALQQSLIGTGFPYRANLTHIERYLGMLKAVMLESAGVRRTGIGGTRPVLRRRGPHRRVLRARLEQVGHRGRRVDHPRGRRPHQRLPRRLTAFLESGNVVAGNPKVYAALSKLLAPFTAGID